MLLIFLSSLIKDVEGIVLLKKVLRIRYDYKIKKKQNNFNKNVHIELNTIFINSNN